MDVLGIETSCDECSISVVRHQDGLQFQVLSLATFSQTDLHDPYGGIVPEVASRSHLETILPLVDRALEEADTDIGSIDAIAVANRPGLIGSLLVGVTTAKALAYLHHKPLAAVHHLEGHAVSPFLDTDCSKIVQYPLLIAIVSGGHTCLYVSESTPLSWERDFLSKHLVARSRDDAAGEAFDKCAKLLGLPYPGGEWIDRKSEGGNPNAFQLPRPLLREKALEYSFSGLKTAVAHLTHKLKEAGKFEASLSDLCASVQEAIVDTLIAKIVLATNALGCKSIALVGGVAANRRLRQKLHETLKIQLIFPLSKYCTDNAAMIAAAGCVRILQGHRLADGDVLTLNALANARD